MFTLVKLWVYLLLCKNGGQAVMEKAGWRCEEVHHKADEVGLGSVKTKPQQL
jgi:hypothetical protein